MSGEEERAAHQLTKLALSAARMHGESWKTKRAAIRSSLENLPAEDRAALDRRIRHADYVTAAGSRGGLGRH